ncbi:MAG TPA: prepilin-type N-terminal cleavage/methylation domain-containing protein [Pirellulales bacterium]|nr:prepilin-type N-terminal cleavage/methylation domain-containing protein [Pirellulales bacterium]
MKAFSGARRLGVSLIELLVVIAIVLVVSAVTMRTLSPALTNRNLREAARMVNVFINAARNRAIQSGRPAGVWIEKMPGLPEVSVNLYQAMVPDPYAGDFSDSGLEAFTIPDWTDTNRINCPYFINVVCPSRRVVVNGQLSTIRNQDTWYTPDQSVQKVVQPGDILKINFNDLPYRLYTLDQIDGTTVSSSGSMSNSRYSGSVPKATGAPSPPDLKQLWVIGIYSNWQYVDKGHASQTLGRINSGGAYRLTQFPIGINSAPYITAGSTMGGGQGQPVPYQIFRRPQKVSSGGIQLPESAVIDLSYSVMTGAALKDGSLPTIDDAPLYPRVQSVTTTSSQQLYGAPGDSQGGSNNKSYPMGQNALLSNGLDPDGSNPEMNPIVITFNSIGLVEMLYAPRWMPDLGKWMYYGAAPTGLIHLHIGKRDKTPCNPDTGSITAQQTNNYNDPDNFWVSINPNSGNISTAPNRYVELNETTYNKNGTVTVSTAIAAAHDFAERGISMGGK